MPYTINEVSGADPDIADLLHHLNSLVPEWPALKPHHLSEGYWWLIQSDETVGFCGMIENVPHYKEGYMKRCFVRTQDRGNGLQIRSLFVRETMARRLGWKNLVSETTNPKSAGNFIRSGYEPCYPEQPWGPVGSMYFTKVL